MGLLDWICGQQQQIQDHGGRGIYNLFEIDLSVARTDEKYHFWGDSIIIQKIDSQAYLKVNDNENDNIDINLVRSIKTPYREFYITNEAKFGKLNILCGSGGIFNAIQNYNPSLPDDRAYIYDISLDELAVRLGSIISFDRRGQIIWYDDFNHDALHWTPSLLGANAGADVTNTYARNGNKSCMLTAGEGAGGFSKIYYDLSSRIKGKFGFETSFTVNPEMDYFQMFITMYTGSHKAWIALRYDHTNNKFQYFNNGTTWTDISSVILNSTNKCWHTMKLIADIDKDEYIRAVLDNVETDITGNELYAVSNSTPLSVGIVLSFFSDHASAQSIYVDNFILTGNEG